MDCCIVLFVEMSFLFFPIKSRQVQSLLKVNTFNYVFVLLELFPGLIDKEEKLSNS